MYMSTYKPIWGKIIDAKTRGFKGHRSELNSKDAAKGYVYQNVTTTYDDLINKETKNKLSERWPVGGSDNSNKSKKGLTRPKPKPPQYDYFIVPDNYMDSSFKFTAEFDAWWEKDDDKLFKLDKSKNKGWGDLDGKKGHKKIPKGANTTKRHLVMTYNKRTNSLVFTPPIAKSSKPKKKRKNKPAPEPAPEPAPKPAPKPAPEQIAKKRKKRPNQGPYKGGRKTGNWTRPKKRKNPEPEPAPEPAPELAPEPAPKQIAKKRKNPNQGPYKGGRKMGNWTRRKNTKKQK
jgi:hypothetical protein